MTSMNGVHHHNVEDILASIRTSIADEAGHTRHITGELQPPVQAAQVNPMRREMPIAEEVPDFELPAIFKPGHASQGDKPKLLGRLSEALKNSNAAEVARTRTVIPFEPASQPRPADPPPGLQRANVTNPTQHAEPAQFVNNVQSGNVKREMPTFFDTRVNKLGELSRQVYRPAMPDPVPVAPPQPQYQPQPQFSRQPPSLPEGNLPHMPSSGVDDAAAQLLRPMLKQWLQENMPKIVEKALLSEVQGDLQPPTPGKPQR